MSRIDRADGFCAAMYYPPPEASAPNRPLPVCLARGFAVVTTDIGHHGRGVIDASFMEGSAGEPGLCVRGDRARRGGGQTDHRATLRPAARSLFNVNARRFDPGTPV